MSTEDGAAREIAAVFVEHGRDHDSTEGSVEKAREIAGLQWPRERHTERLTTGEGTTVLDAARARSGRDGLMLRTLLETGTRDSELAGPTCASQNPVACVSSFTSMYSGSPCSSLCWTVAAKPSKTHRCRTIWMAPSVSSRTSASSPYRAVKRSSASS